MTDDFGLEEMGRRVSAEEKSNFKKYQEGTIDGIKGVRDAAGLLFDDDMIFTGAQVKKWLDMTVERVEFERDEWERKYNL